MWDDLVQFSLVIIHHESDHYHHVDLPSLQSITLGYEVFKGGKYNDYSDYYTSEDDEDEEQTTPITYTLTMKSRIVYAFLLLLLLPIIIIIDLPSLTLFNGEGFNFVDFDLVVLESTFWLNKFLNILLSRHSFSYRRWYSIWWSFIQVHLLRFCQAYSVFLFLKSILDATALYYYLFDHGQINEQPHFDEQNEQNEQNEQCNTVFRVSRSLLLDAIPKNSQKLRFTNYYDLPDGFSRDTVLDFSNFHLTALEVFHIGKSSFTKCAIIYFKCIFILLQIITDF